jgi:cytochrome c oxidase cbb3-type subunit I/II
MEMQQFYYDNKIVKKFIYATIVFGIVGMTVGLLLATLFYSLTLQMAFRG